MNFSANLVRTRFQALLAELPVLGAVFARGTAASTKILAASLASFTATVVRGVCFDAGVEFVAGLSRTILRSFDAAISSLAAWLAGWWRKPTPASRLFAVGKERRVFVVAPESRMFAVYAEHGRFRA
jgi:hypothetical protein